jgi:hypothetical protein
MSETAAHELVTETWQVVVERCGWVIGSGLVLLGVAGWLNPYGALILDEFVVYPAVWLSVGLMALAAGTLVGRRRTLAQVFAVVAIVVSVVLLAATTWWAWWSDWEQGESFVSPDDPELRVIVDEGSAMIDPLWRFKVQKGSGITGHRWSVTCINGDAKAFRTIEWTTIDDQPAFRIRLRGGPSPLVVLDPSTGQPRDEIPSEC